jgi:DNA (cytosine-5)-methyltransferase 1
MTDQPRIESLFSGIGGLDLAVERVFGARCWVHVEQEPYQRAVLARHWPDVARFTDVCLYHGKGAEIVCGGFPCQNISALGDQTGLEGAKSGLWREFARIIGESEPDCVIIENVKDLRTRGLAEVIRDLASLGYACAWVTIKANAAGIYLQRARIILLAIPDGSRRNWSPPTWLQGSEFWQAHEVDGCYAGLPWPADGSRRSPNDGPEPGICRAARGVSGRLDEHRRRARIRSLGNAVVPAQAELALRYLVPQLLRALGHSETT